MSKHLQELEQCRRKGTLRDQSIFGSKCQAKLWKCMEVCSSCEMTYLTYLSLPQNLPILILLNEWYVEPLNSWWPHVSISAWDAIHYGENLRKLFVGVSLKSGCFLTSRRACASCSRNGENEEGKSLGAVVLINQNKQTLVAHRGGYELKKIQKKTTSKRQTTMMIVDSK